METINVPKIPTEESNLSALWDNYVNMTQIKLYQVSPPILVLLSVAYMVICVVAVVANALVLWLVLPSNQLRTVTNLLIANLAGTDMIIAVLCIPFQFQEALLQRWILPHFLCSLCSFVHVLCVTVSALSVAVIAVHRYKVLVCPITIASAPGIMNTAKEIIFTLWGISILIAVPTYLDYRVVAYPSKYNEITLSSEHFCEPSHLSALFRWHYSQFLVLIQYLMPLLIMTGAYAKVGYHLWKLQPEENPEFPANLLLEKNKRTVTKIMVRHVLLFAILWLPFQAYNFLSVHFPNVNEYFYIKLIWFGINWLAMSSSCWNPFVYALLDLKFQRELLWRSPRIYQYYSRWLRDKEDSSMYEMYRR